MDEPAERPAWTSGDEVEAPLPAFSAEGRVSASRSYEPEQRSATDAVADGVRRLGGLLSGAGRAVRMAALVLVGAGVAGLGLGLAAWHGSVLAVLVVLVLTVPAVVAPIVLRRRIAALVETATHPAEVADQARDMFGRLRGGGELTQLADRLRGTGPGGRGRRGRFFQAIGVARAASSVVGLGEPDPERHRLLVPLAPQRIASLWTWLLVALWGGAVAAVVAVVAVVVLLLSAL